MAIYHARIKTFSRAKGHSSAAAAAYRAGLLLIDARTGTRHDYRRRGGVVETRCVAPDEAPDWAFSPSELWAAAEAAERRKDATVAREFEIALPHELDDAQRSSLVSAISRALVERYRFAVQASIHSPDSPDGLNYHAHILATTRRIEETGLTDKTRELDGGASGRVEVEWTREMVANVINAHLAAAQLDARVDHRSLEAQADAALERGDVAAAVLLTRQPTEHIGKDATALHRRGEETQRMANQDDIHVWNEASFEEMLAKFEGEGRAMPMPESHSHERAKNDRSRASAIALSSVLGGGDIRVVRGLGRSAPNALRTSLATSDERRRAAEAALHECTNLWDQGIAARVDVALTATARIIKHRTALLAAFVQDAPFAVYVRELLRRLKKLKRDATRLVRREAAAKRAQRLLHQASRTLEQFDAEQTGTNLWSRREWSKRRTRRLAALELRTKEMESARLAISEVAERRYAEEARQTAKAVEEWSVGLLKRYPVAEETAASAASTLAPSDEPDLDATLFENASLPPLQLAEPRPAPKPK